MPQILAGYGLVSYTANQGNKDENHFPHESYSIYCKTKSAKFFTMDNTIFPHVIQRSVKTESAKALVVQAG
jgi:hypothetical protein